MSSPSTNDQTIDQRVLTHNNKTVSNKICDDEECECHLVVDLLDKFKDNTHYDNHIFRQDEVDRQQVITTDNTFAERSESYIHKCDITEFGPVPIESDVITSEGDIRFNSIGLFRNNWYVSSPLNDDQTARMQRFIDVDFIGAKDYGQAVNVQTQFCRNVLIRMKADKNYLPSPYFLCDIYAFLVSAVSKKWKNDKKIRVCLPITYGVGSDQHINGVVFTMISPELMLTKSTCPNDPDLHSGDVFDSYEAFKASSLKLFLQKRTQLKDKWAFRGFSHSYKNDKVSFGHCTPMVSRYISDSYIKSVDERLKYSIPIFMITSLLECLDSPALHNEKPFVGASFRDMQMVYGAFNCLGREHIENNHVDVQISRDYPICIKHEFDVTINDVPDLCSTAGRILTFIGMTTLLEGESDLTMFSKFKPWNDKSYISNIRLSATALDYNGNIVDLKDLRPREETLLLIYASILTFYAKKRNRVKARKRINYAFPEFCRLFDGFAKANPVEMVKMLMSVDKVGHITGSLNQCPHRYFIDYLPEQFNSLVTLLLTKWD